MAYFSFRRNIQIFSVFLGVFLGLAVTIQTPNAFAVIPANYCSTTVTDIPYAECEALRNIYGMTDGDNWTNKTGWGTRTTVCDNNGTGWYGITCTNGHVTAIGLSENNLAGTGDFGVYGGGSLPFLETLFLSDNQLTSFNGTGLSSLRYLYLASNQLTSFNGTELSSLTTLFLNVNQLTSFDSTGLSSLTNLFLNNNQLTSFNGTGLSSLHHLILSNNQLASFNSTGLSSLISLSLNNNLFSSFNGTGLSSLEYLYLYNNQLTSFNGTGLSSLTYLALNNNQLTSFNGTGLSSITLLSLEYNQLASFNSTGLSSLQYLSLGNNQLTSFNSTGLSSIILLGLDNNLLSSFNGTGLSFLQNLSLNNNQLASFNGTGLSSLEYLYLNNNQLASFNGTGLSSLTYLTLNNNLLSSFNGTGLSSLTTLAINNNQLTSFNSTGLSSLQELSLSSNQLTSFNGTGLSSLTTLSIDNNQLSSFSNTDLSSLSVLDLSNNQLSTFSSGWFEMSLGMLSLAGNHIKDIPDWTTFFSLWYLTIGNNCLIPGAIDTDFASWLTYTAADDWTSQSPTCPVVTFCDTVTDVPPDECRALMSIYANTGGDTWTNTLANNNKWGVSTTVQDWYGVDVYIENGQSVGNVVGIGIASNALQGDFAITEGNLNSLSYLDIGSNDLTSFDGFGMNAIADLYLRNNIYLTSFSGSNLATLNEANLQNTALTSFNGTGMSSVTYLDLSSSELTSFNGAGLSSIASLHLEDNKLTSFNGVGFSFLRDLYISNNQLTSFSATGLSSLAYLELSNNRISSLNQNILNLIDIPNDNSSVGFSYNCLDSSSLPINIVDWLDGVTFDDWRNLRNPACPPLPGTLYFWNASGSGDWNVAGNWYTDIDHSNPAGKIPDASTNAIIYSNISSNSGTPAKVKTLQVVGESVVSIPIINNATGNSYTTNLAGDNNDIIWTSSDPEVTITYATPVEQAETTVEVNGKNITITPGTKSVMNAIDGPSGYPIKVFFVRREGGELGPIIWTSTGAYNENSFSGLVCTMQLGMDYYAVCELYENGFPTGGAADRTATQPYGWYAYLDDIPQNLWDSGISFQPMASSASQVIAAVLAKPEAAALISGTLASGNDGTGSVTAMSAKAISTPSETYATPMSFLDTSINAEFDTSTPAAIAAKKKNTLTGNAVFACTAQNLGIVTGTTIFTPCSAPEFAPATVSLLTDTTPTFTGVCRMNTLVTIYADDIGMVPSAVCQEDANPNDIFGTYSITTTLAPGEYIITAKQSNRKGPTFGTSPASAELEYMVSCAAEQVWNGTSCTSNCTTTEAPSELKANVDKPYISCTDSTKGAQFKYRISDPNNPAFTPIVSGTYSTGVRGVLYEGVLTESGTDGIAGSVDTTFNSYSFNNGIGYIIPYGNGVLAVGSFTTYNGAPKNYMARFLQDGTLDNTFTPTSGPNGTVTKAVVQSSDNKIVIIGPFSYYDGQFRGRIARLNSSGTLDASFNPVGVGQWNSISDVAIQEQDNKILIGGNFTSYGGASNNNYITRLNSTDGSRDTSFVPVSGANNVVDHIIIQSDNKIIITGLFTTYDGVNRYHIARLNPNGTLDPSFTSALTIADTIYSIALQPDGKILIGGNFYIDNVFKNRVIRLDSSGSIDTIFPAVTGDMGSTISSIVVQLDGKILIHGTFGYYNGITVRGLVRVHQNGERDTSFDTGNNVYQLYANLFLETDGDIIIPATLGNKIVRLHGSGVPSGYKVECLYSNDNNTFTADDDCTKTMAVRESTPGNEIQGCERISNNFENFVGYEKWIHDTGFNANVSCMARKADPEIDNPFIVHYGTAFTDLGYLNSGVDVGRLVSAGNIHTFDSSLSTTTTCAVRVGDGYSTNSLCQNVGCGGPECDTPGKYLIQPSEKNLYCTKEDTAEYMIGCAPGDTYATCISTACNGTPEACALQYLYYGLTLQASGEYSGKYTKTRKFRLDADTTSAETIRTIVCPSNTPQTNESTDPTCTVSLPTGRELGMLVANDPADQYQVVRDTIPRDTEFPIAIIKEADEGTMISSDGKKLTAIDNQWLNKGVTVTVTCQNELVENNDTCTCGWLYQEEIRDDTSILANKPSESFSPHIPLGDIVDYKRNVFGGEILKLLHIYFADTANNLDRDSGVDISLGVDDSYPSISGTVVNSTNPEATRIKLTATDVEGGSGLWGAGIRSAVINNDGNINAVFDADCNLNSPIPITTPATTVFTTLVNIVPSYAPFPEIGAGFGPKDSSEIIYNVGTQKIVYCVQDNAKNRLVGVYPFDPNLLIGCFSDGSQQFVPTLDVDDDANDGQYYAGANSLSLLQRLSPGILKYGYELTDPDKAVSMADFRTKLAQNIETLVKQQYCPTTKTEPSAISFNTQLTVDLEEKGTTEDPITYAARVKTNEGCSTVRNTKGYYYFQGDDANDVVNIAGVPRLTGTKVLIVEGANIYLGGDIQYFSRESSLVIIALKKDGNGGNVYVHPEVTNIDATIIADGALMNGKLSSGNMTPQVWFNDNSGELKNPLTINGRLLTYNTRGGSLEVDGDSLKITGTPKCSSHTTPTASELVCGELGNPNLAVSSYDPEDIWAGLRDLERFRVVMRVPDEWNNRCSLHVTGVSALNRPEILTRTGF